MTGPLGCITVCPLPCCSPGVLIMESLEHAQKRGATILAEYLGGKQLAGG